MPRQSRLDAPGLLHHVMARGIERRRIFTNKHDYQDFFSRVESLSHRFPQQILAWALMPNHFHLLIRSGKSGLTSFMQRLMTGYAIGFNARHNRVGHLFQNRFKSIVCEEYPYLLELVRYIHLNPVRAGLLRSMEALKEFPYTGHGVILGNKKFPWQNTAEVLILFGEVGSLAKKRYESFVKDGFNQGERRDLMGGGLVRSLGGMGNALAARHQGARELSDQRVLGSGAFVMDLKKSAEKKMKLQIQTKQEIGGLMGMAKKVAEATGIATDLLFQRNRTEKVSRAKSLFIYLGVELFEKSVRDMAGVTRMSDPGASKARTRGQELAESADFKKLLQVN